MSMGEAMGHAILGAAILAFLAGMAFILGLWALWHYVLVHVHVAWS
jgi:hypothetical protein